MTREQTFHFTDLKKFRSHKQWKSGYLLDRNVTPPGLCGQQLTCASSSLRLLPTFTLHFKLFLCVFLKFAASCLSLLVPAALPRSLPPQSLPILSRLSLSDKLFVGWNLSCARLPRSQVLSLTLSLFVSVSLSFWGPRPNALPSYTPPSPPLWVSPFPLHPDCPEHTLHLRHTPKYKVH